MRNFLLLIIGLLLFHITGMAQYNLKENNVWVFGYHAGLDFNSGTAVPIMTGMNYNGTGIAPEGCVSVSDANGQLLFYTMGDTIWNKNHVPMPNGYDMLPVPAGTKCTRFSGGTNASVSSTTQGVLILPILGNPDQYYVFCLQNSCLNDPQAGRLYYSIVDMTLGSGLGEVVAGSKGIKIDSALSEKMIAIPGDSCNIWLLVHTNQTDSFKAYNITGAGINPIPVISRTGSIKGTYAYSLGTMKISPNLKKLAIASTGFAGNGGIGLELCDFDPATGIVSNAATINSEIGYGVCFSSDNSKMYANSISLAMGTTEILQYDISLPTLTDIVNSKTVLYSKSGSTIKDLQLAPDDKIYLSAGAKNKDSMDVIELPNVAGLACQFKHNAFQLLAGTQISQGINNLYVKPIKHDTAFAVALDTIVCRMGKMSLPGHTGSAAFLWSNGVTDDTITISQRGTYWVISTDGCYSFVDTFLISGADLPPLAITVNKFVLGTASKYDTYQWYLDGNELQGETNDTITAAQNGVYSVKVSNSYGCSDSVSYTVTNVGVPDITQLKAAIKVYPNPASGIIHISSPIAVSAVVSTMDGRNVANASVGEDINITHLPEGMYLVRILNSDGQLIRTEKITRIK